MNFKEMKTIGQINYEAYCSARGWVAYNGDAIPQWAGLNRPGDDKIKEAWEAAAQAVIDTIFK